MMTIDELLNRPDTDGLTDAQIEEILSPWFPLTRPRDLPDAGVTAMNNSKIAPELQAKLEAMRAAKQQNSLLTMIKK